VLSPENTLQTFQNAIDFGADVIETDVQITKDRLLVNFHDDRVDRVTNGSGTLLLFVSSLVI
jgi:glycerophosphoryl diester phosphodiesterase